MYGRYDGTINKNKSQISTILNLIIKDLKLSKPTPINIKNMIINYIHKYIIYGVGQNLSGELGLNHFNKVITYERLNNLESLINHHHNIYKNSSSLIIKTSDNKIFCTGNNVYCSLGLPLSDNIYDNNNIKKCTQIPINNVDIVSKGTNNVYHTFIYNIQNILYANGKNTCGCFGDGNIDNRGTSYSDNMLNNGERLLKINTTKWLINHNKITDIQCGYAHSLFLTSDSIVFACGLNTQGACIIKNDNKYYSPYIFKPILVAENIKMMSCGRMTSTLLTAEYVVQSFGDNRKNGVYTIANKIVSIKSSDHVLCLDEKNNVFSFGENHYGQCGIDNTLVLIQEDLHHINVNTDIIDIECGGAHSILVSNDNELYVFGNNMYKQCSTILKDENIFLPHLFDKNQELGHQYVIQKVICTNFETLLIIDAFDK